jgi:hypothetical protein
MLQACDARAVVASDACSHVVGGRVMFSSGTTGTPKAIRHGALKVHPRDAPSHLGEFVGGGGVDQNVPSGTCALDYLQYDY